MTVAAVVARGRRKAEALMVDTCVIYRPDPTAPIQPDGTREDTVLYEGKCKVQSFRANEQNPIVGGAEATVLTQELHVPVTAGDFHPDDWGEITASELSPTLAGTTRFLIVRTDDKSIQTAQRLGIKVRVA